MTYDALTKFLGKPVLVTYMDGRQFRGVFTNTESEFDTASGKDENRAGRWDILLWHPAGRDHGHDGALMKRTEAYRQFIEDKLRERYPTFLLHGRTSFQAPDGTILRIDTLNWAQEALVVEYAYDETWAENNVFEDGDLFYLDELSPEEMLAGMLAEIEGTPDPTLPAE